MKICSVCLSSDILCSGCLRRLEKGEISRTDVELSRALHKIGGIDFLQTFEEDGRLFVVVESAHAKKFIGPGGKNIRKISELLGRQVKLMEKASGSEKHIIEKLIGEPVHGVNKVYAGGEFFKIRVERRFARNVMPLKDVIGKVLNKKVSFVFE